MLLRDSEIKELIEHKVLTDAKLENITSIAYDLSTKQFYSDRDTHVTEIDLMPNSSVFVGSEECIYLPDDMCAQITLRNSRIRQGLLLEAPIYQPGHKTRVFFRITNISTAKIHLSTKDGIASICFEKLSGAVEHPYTGAFCDEFDFKGLGAYDSKYRSQMTDIEKKVEDIQHIERKMYGNVITLLTIFIGIFSLLNVNISLALSGTVTIQRLLTFNLSTIGSIAFLVAIIQTVAASHQTKAAKVLCWVVTAIAFVAAFISVLI